MATAPLDPRRPAGSSPFDSIRHVETDPEFGEFEFWEARELMDYLGYDRWERFSDAIDRAKAACRAMHYEMTDHFRGSAKMVPLGSGAFRSVDDYQLTRFGCYLVAMSSDSRKPPVASALQYFAIQTRRAELELPPQGIPSHTPVLNIGTWALRFRRTFMPHVRELYQRHPGCFSVVSAVATQILVIEDQIVHHQMTTRAFDRPDISIGKTWATNRKDRGAPEPTRSSALYLPDQNLNVQVAVYDPAEWGDFATWFHRCYLADKLPKYLHKKPELGEFPAVSRASVADNACRELTGSNANLPARLRTDLAARGGFAPAPQLPPGSHPPTIGG